MSAEEFAMHAADWQREPWGEFRVELAGGVVAATIANAHRAKDARVFSPADFMPISYPHGGAGGRGAGEQAELPPVSDGAAALAGLHAMGVL